MEQQLQSDLGTPGQKWETLQKCVEEGKGAPRQHWRKDLRLVAPAQDIQQNLVKKTETTKSLQQNSATKVAAIPAKVQNAAKDHCGSIQEYQQEQQQKSYQNYAEEGKGAFEQQKRKEPLLAAPSAVTDS